MSVRIAVLTPTIPGRERLLAECVAAVQDQTLQPDEHRILCDRQMSGQTGTLLDEMAEATDCDWLAVAADDDLMLPHHLETLAAHTDEADVIHSRCRVEGRGRWEPNYTTEIPAYCMVSRALWEKVGGWGGVNRAEDHDFFKTARKKGAHFRFVDEVTWVYRFGLAGQVNKSLVAGHHSFREAHEAASRV